MKLKTYHILIDCIEQGIVFGWSMAHKHTDAPGAEVVQNEIYKAICNEIFEYFTFDDEVEE